MAEPWGKPALPPSPRRKGQTVARFDAFLPDQWCQFSRDGKHLIIRLAVDAEDEWKARLLADARGLNIHFEATVDQTTEEEAIARLIELAQGGKQ